MILCAVSQCKAKFCPSLGSEIQKVIFDLPGGLMSWITLNLRLNYIPLLRSDSVELPSYFLKTFINHWTIPKKQWFCALMISELNALCNWCWICSNQMNSRECRIETEVPSVTYLVLLKSTWAAYWPQAALTLIIARGLHDVSHWGVSVS